jgi:hypothetical protein
VGLGCLSTSTVNRSAALMLYTLYLQGELLIKDYPLDLINAAIERSTVSDEFICETSMPLKEESNSSESLKILFFSVLPWPNF